MTGRLETAVQAGPGALEGTVDRIFAGLEHVGHLAGVAAEDVPEHERGPLAGREVLEAAMYASEIASLASQRVSFPGVGSATSSA